LIRGFIPQTEGTNSQAFRLTHRRTTTNVVQSAIELVFLKQSDRFRQDHFLRSR
jgi:hypothetical protein